MVTYDRLKLKVSPRLNQLFSIIIAEQKLVFVVVYSSENSRESKNSPPLLTTLNSRQFVEVISLAEGAASLQCTCLQ